MSNSVLQSFHWMQSPSGFLFLRPFLIDFRHPLCLVFGGCDAECFAKNEYKEEVPPPLAVVVEEIGVDVKVLVTYTLTLSFHFSK